MHVRALSRLQTIIALIVGCVLGAPTITGLRKPAFDASDFGAFWRAGEWRRGGPSLYPMSSFGLGEPEPFRGYLNPPHVAVLFRPFATMNLQMATHVWLAINGILLAAVLAMLMKTMNRGRLVTGAMVLGSPALAATLVNGTMTLIVVVGLFMVVWPMITTNNTTHNTTHDKTHDTTQGTTRTVSVWQSSWMPALGLALMSVKPQYAVLPCVALLCAKQWKVLGTSAALVAIWVVISLPATGLQSWSDYTPFLGEYTRRADLWAVTPQDWWLPTQMVNLRGMLLKLFGMANIGLANLLATLGLLAIAGVVCALITKARTIRATRAAWVTVILLTVFGAQHSNVSDALVLVVAVPLALRCWPEHATKTLWLSIGFGIALAFGNPSGVTVSLPWSALALTGLIGVALRAVVLAQQHPEQQTTGGAPPVEVETLVSQVV
jgi:hypothetical protein